jgi:nuclear control of ATPase protein 2
MVVAVLAIRPTPTSVKSYSLMHWDSKRRRRYHRLRFWPPRRTMLLFVLFFAWVNTNIYLPKAYGWKLNNLFRREGNARNENNRNGDGPSMRNIDDSFEKSLDEKDNIGGASDIREDFTQSESAVNVESATNDEGWFPWNRIIEDSSLHRLVDVDAHLKGENVIASDECEAASLPSPNTPAMFRPFSRILPSFLEKAHRMFQVSKEHISRIVLYQPPLGIVTVIVVLRLVLSGRLFRWYTYYYNHDVNIEDQLFLQKLQQKDHSIQYPKRRSFVLNRDDTSYISHGGAEWVRTRLCLAALQNVVTSSESNLSSLDEHKNTLKRQQFMDLIRLAKQSLMMSSSPIGSWLQLIYEMIIPLSQIEELESQLRIRKLGFRQPEDDISFYLAGDHGNISSDIPPNGIMNLLSISITTGQMRLYDAMLRLCRDRVLQTTYRLARTVEHWERRLKFRSSSNTMHVNRLLQRILRIHTIEDDRLGLSLAKAAYNMEVKRLGEITSMLMDRPLEMDESNVIYALKATERRRLLQSEHEMPSSTKTHPFESSTEHPMKTMFAMNVFGSGLLSAVLTLPSSLRSLSKYSFRWKADGKGFLSIRKFDNSDGYIDGRSAFEVLSPDDKANTLSISDRDLHGTWMKQAQEWIDQVQRLIFSVIRESLQASRSASLPSDCSEGDFQQLAEKWYMFANIKDLSDQQQQNRNTQFPDTMPSLETLNREQQWRSMVNYIDTSTSWQRIGEGEKIRLRDVFGMKDWVTRLDMLGIPSSIFYIYVAHQVHKRFVIPHWSTVQQHVVDFSQKAWEILQQRVWVPLKGIYDDIMNRSPSMMSALGLEVEEISLDHMLRDLNFGDGTPATRQEAIRKATEQYERDLSHGLFANFARGRLIRLLLIQVQQLKVGMLSALDTIDVLIEGNRIHFKVLAAIPAVAIVTFGTKYFFRALYNIRAKDFRPISAVHNEMTQYLNRIEKILLLSGEGLSEDRKDHFEKEASLRARNSSRLSRNGHMNLKPIELGEMVLNTHRYLILLDFSSPQPFPASLCDEIHSSLQQFYRSAQPGGSDRSSIFHRLDSSRQIQWLSTIQQKHQDLAKFL